MIHAADETTSNVVSKSISRRRGPLDLPRPGPHPEAPQGLQEQHRVRRPAHQQPTSRTDTYPAITVRGNQHATQHEASVTQVSEEMLFYMQQRGLNEGRGDVARRQRLHQRPRPRVPDGILRRAQAPHRSGDGRQRRVTASLVEIEILILPFPATMPEGLMEPPAPATGTSVFEIAPNLDSDLQLPAWFSEYREGAWKEFQSLPAPVRTDENWRFADLKRLPSEADDFRMGDPVSDEVAAEILERSPASENAVARFVFANGVLIASDQHSDSGALCLPLLEALRDHSELVRAHFAKRTADLGSARYAALNQAHAGSGVFVFVPKSVELTGPIEIYHWAAGDGVAIFPQVIVHAEDNARVTVIEHLGSHGDGSGFYCGATSIESVNGAAVRHAISQDVSSTSKSGPDQSRHDR